MAHAEESCADVNLLNDAPHQVQSPSAFLVGMHQTAFFKKPHLVLHDELKSRLAVESVAVVLTEHAIEEPRLRLDIASAEPAKFFF